MKDAITLAREAGMGGDAFGWLASNHAIEKFYALARADLAAEVEKLEKDAARYQWLLFNCALGIKQFGLGWSLNTRQGIAPESLKDVSAAIDKAMEATNGQGT